MSENQTPTKKQRPLMNFLKKVFSSPIVRGTIKTLPFGNVVYEIAQNIQHAKDETKKELSTPHSAISLIAQVVFLGLIVWAFATHQITIKEILNMVGIDDFKDFGNITTPGPLLIGSDSIGG